MAEAKKGRPPKSRAEATRAAQALEQEIPDVNTTLDETEQLHACSQEESEPLTGPRGEETPKDEIDQEVVEQARLTKRLEEREAEVIALTKQRDELRQQAVAQSRMTQELQRIRQAEAEKERLLQETVGLRDKQNEGHHEMNHEEEREARNRRNMEGLVGPTSPLPSVVSMAEWIQTKIAEFRWQV